MPKMAKVLAILYFAICVSPGIISVTQINQTSNEVITREANGDAEIQPLETQKNNEVELMSVKEEVLMPHGQVKEDCSRFREEPNYESTVKDLLHRGMIVDVIERHEEFLKVSFNGEIGYIDISLIEQYQDDPPYELYVEPEEPVSEEQVDGIPHFNPYNLRELSNLSERQIYNMLEGSALQTLSRAYYYYEKEYNVNAIFLMALNSEESGHGRSSLAITHNNLGGVKQGNSWRYFNDWGESLQYIANLIDTMYLTPGGSYYYGESIWNVNTKYCEGTQWATNLINIANGLIRKI